MTEVFVFGSNLAGRHGKGAALEARQNWGAVYGSGEGWQANGRLGTSYAIPTKGYRLEVLPLDHIRLYVDAFLDQARLHPASNFRLTAIGCGLAGYTPSQIAPFFRDAPANVILPPEFVAVLQPENPA